MTLPFPKVPGAIFVPSLQGNEELSIYNAGSVQTVCTVQQIANLAPTGATFPSTQFVTTNHATPTTVGLKNITYITTDGSGLQQQIIVPTPPDDSGGNGEDAFWVEQWMVFMLVSQVNASDVVTFNVNGSISNPISSAFFDPKVVSGISYEATSLNLVTPGAVFALRWSGNAWLIANENSSLNSLNVSPANTLTIKGSTGDSSTNSGQPITLIAGNAISNSSGGGVTLTAGNTPNSTGTSIGGTVSLNAGSSPVATSAAIQVFGVNSTSGGGVGGGGDIKIIAGNQQNTDTTKAGGQVLIQGGNGYFQSNITSTANCGAVRIFSGNAASGSNSTGSFIVLQSGIGDQSNTSSSGPIYINTAATTSATNYGSGSIILETGNAVNSTAGDIIIEPGTHTGGTGRAGLVFLENLPTTDPGISQAIWNDNGYVVFSGSVVPFSFGWSCIDISTKSISSVIARFVAPIAWTLPATTSTPAGHAYGKVNTAPTATTTFTLLKNGSSVATVQWAASATTPTFTNSSDINFSPGDYLDLQTPSNLNSMAGVFGISLAGHR